MSVTPPFPSSLSTAFVCVYVLAAAALTSTRCPVACSKNQRPGRQRDRDLWRVLPFSGMRPSAILTRNEPKGGCRFLCLNTIRTTSSLASLRLPHGQFELFNRHGDRGVRLIRGETSIRLR